MTEKQMKTTADEATMIRRELSQIELRAAELRKRLRELDDDKKATRIEAARQHQAERRQHAVRMHADGASYAAIGRELGVTGHRAAQIIETELRRRHGLSALPVGSLSGRTLNCLRNHFGYSADPLTKEQILEASERITDLLRTPNFGKRSAKELTALAERLRAS